MAPTQITDLGTAPDGAPFLGIDIAGPLLRARVLTSGAALQDLRLAGHPAPLVLGYAEPQAYFNNPHKLGVVVGRYANRIAGGRFTLDGQVFDLDRNEKGRQTLHGGSDGTQTKSWALVDHASNRATLAITLPDGHMGFPGQLEARCTYRIDGPALSIDLTATTTAPTVCNLTSHSYFTLTGLPTLAGHRLTLAADHYMPVDENQIPQAAPAPVAETAFDFRSPRPIDTRLDHNFCLAPARRALAKAARLEAEGIAMTLATTEPGVQVYDGRALDRTGQTGLSGKPYGPHAGLALEPQAWPDAPNKDWAAQAILRPDETYRHETRLTFAAA